MKKNICLFSLFILLFTWIGCGNNTANSKNGVVVENITDSIKGKDECFIGFLKRFHNDSVFAMSRLCDTILGINTDTHEFDSIKDDFVMDTIWCVDSIPNYYSFLNKFKNTDDVVVEYDSTTIPVQEYMYIPESSCFIKLRFTSKNHKWFLCGFDFAFL